MVREGHGLGIYFLTYELLVQKALAKTGKERKDLPSSMAMLFGAFAGVAVRLSKCENRMTGFLLILFFVSQLWLSAYPIE